MEHWDSGPSIDEIIERVMSDSVTKEEAQHLIAAVIDDEDTVSPKDCECRTWAGEVYVQEAEMNFPYHHRNCKHYDKSVDVSKTFFKIAPKDDPKNYYVERSEHLLTACEALEEGDGYIVSPIYMSEREYRRLDEFMGF